MSTVTLIRNEHGAFVPRKQPTSLGEQAALAEQFRLAGQANELEAEMETFLSQTSALDESTSDLDPIKGRVHTSGRDTTGTSSDQMVDSRHLEMDPITGQTTSFQRHSQGTSYWHVDGLVESWFSGGAVDAPSLETASYKAGPLLAMSTSVLYEHPKKPERKRHEQQSLRETEPGVFTFEYNLVDSSRLHAWYCQPGVFGQRLSEVAP